MSKRPVTVSSRRQSAPSALGDDQRRSLGIWQDRIRDPSLTVLLVLELCAMFIAVPLAAKGLPIARVVADTLVLAALAIVVLLSQKWGAISPDLAGDDGHRGELRTQRGMVTGFDHPASPRR